MFKLITIGITSFVTAYAAPAVEHDTNCRVLPQERRAIENGVIEEARRVVAEVNSKMRVCH